MANAKLPGVWYAILSAPVLLPILFPIYQWIKTGGYFFYQNAYDEYSYLSYDGALFKRGLVRPSEYLICWLHEWGLSSGYINFMFDLILVGTIVLLLKEIFFRLGHDAKDAVLFTLMLCALPVLFGVSISLYSEMFYWTLKSNWVYWLSLPEAYFPPFYRTPDPQFSFLLICGAVLAFLRTHKILLLYVVVPFLYVFVKVPYLFIVLSVHLWSLNKKYGWLNIRYTHAILAFLSYVVLSVVVGLYYQFRIKGTLDAEFLIESRLPLVSGTSVVCLGIWWCLRKSVTEEKRRILGLISFSPLMAVNTQIISGFIAMPKNYEQYFGAVCFAILVAYWMASLNTGRWLKRAQLVAGVLLIGIYTKTIFVVNSHPVLSHEMPPQLINALREDSSSVIFENAALGSTMSMVFPRQPFTGLAFSQSYDLGAFRYFEHYLCVKEKIRKNPSLSEKYEPVLKVLDHGYRHLHTDFIFVHINRPKKIKTFFEPQKRSDQCDSKPLFFYP